MAKQVLENDSQKLRIVNVGYLNSVPYRAVSEAKDVSYQELAPAECARSLHEGECDLALIPLAEFFQHGGYQLLNYGIASNGPVKSVFLFAKQPFETLERIYIDSSSQTSVNLLRLILNELYTRQSKRIVFHRTSAENIPALIENEAGGLLIGDRAFGMSSQFPYQLDLGETWYDITSLPFLFAAWATRRDRLAPEQMAEITRLFDFGIGQRAVFAREWAETHNSDRKEAERYVHDNIVYKIDDSIIYGAMEFLRRGINAGLFPATELDLKSAKDMRFFKSPALSRTSSRSTVDSLLNDAAQGARLSLSEGIEIASAASLSDLSIAADRRRQSLHPTPGVSYIVDRNINYTNVCNVYCRFCAFYRAPGRSGGYLLTKEEIGQKIQETLDAGGIQILLQGGLNPELGIEYYEDLFRWIKDNYAINLHALSADEILHICNVSKLSIEQTLSRLMAAGLGSLPGGGAEILVDRVRKRIARLKSSADLWLEVHRTAHRLGLRSTCTMMFGVQETWEDRLLHLQKLRQLQDETSGFTAFITWPFQDENLKLKRGDTSAPEYLRVQAVSRLFLDNIANIQSSWVTMGPSIGQVALYFGANDFGSVMFEENVVSSAGTTYCLDSALIERHITEAGFFPWRRDVHYQMS